MSREQGKDLTQRREGAKKKRLKENGEQKAVSSEQGKKMSMSEAWKGAKLGGFAA